MKASHSKRSNLKQSSTSTLRESMNQRRHDLSSQIRKTRRTHQVQLKRRQCNHDHMSGSSSISKSGISSSSGSGMSIQDLIHSLLANPTESVIQELQQIMASSNFTGSTPTSSTDSTSSAMDIITKLLLQDEPQKGKQFLSICHEILLSQSQSKHDDDLASRNNNNTMNHNKNVNKINEMKLQILRIITNLAATTMSTVTNGSNSNSKNYNNDNDDDEFNYYGPSSLHHQHHHHHHQSWCELIICNMLQTSLIPCLHYIQNLHQNNIMNIDSHDDDYYYYYHNLQIVSQTCWVIGNLAGDDSILSSSYNISSSTTTSSITASNSIVTTTRAFMIQQTNVIFELIQVLKRTITIFTLFNTTTVEATANSMNHNNNDNDINNRTEYYNVYMEIMRNALWALSNLARGTTVSSSKFISNDENHNNQLTLSSSLLTCSDIIAILEVEQLLTNNNPPTMTINNNNNEHYHNNTKNTNKDQASWIEIKVELYWLLAFLTARDDDDHNIVGYLFCNSYNNQGNESNLFKLIICDFAHCTDQILSYFITNERRQSSQLVSSSSVVAVPSCVAIDNNKYSTLIRMVIPLLRIIGNISCAQSGSLVPMILTTQTQTTHHYTKTKQPENIASILSKWMSVIEYQPSHDIMSISTEATWVCGALLCDVGYNQHPSTTIGCPILIPLLCNVLVCKNGNATLDWKRECLSALWNALSPPPTNNNNNTVVQGVTVVNLGEDTIQVRDELLQSLCAMNGLLKAIVDIIQTVSDVDAHFFALKIIDVVHRRVLDRFDPMGIVKRALHEADCLNVLESVCDNASANAQYGHGRDWDDNVVDNCADIAANLIDDYYDDDIGDTGITMEGADHFAFHVDQNNNQRFDFSEMNNYNCQTINMAPHREVSPVSSMSAEGMGRGRGKVIPAWMNKK